MASRREVPDADVGPDESSETSVQPPFSPRSYGAEFVWANSPVSTNKILHVRAGQVVAISTAGRTHMSVMLTTGRAVLELRHDDQVEHVELVPLAPVAVPSQPEHRLVAVTEVELFVTYSPIADP